MAAILAGSNTFSFADGGSGHVCDLGSSPTVGQVDVLCVNSDTTVSTPTGFTAAPSSVNQQGSYIFRRVAAGSEGSTVTVITTGNFNCQVSWSRWDNISAADDATATQASVNGTSTPAHSTATLSTATELVIAFAALHEFGASLPAAPSWSAGYTPLSTATQGTGGTGVMGLVAYKQPAGTAAETPSVSWTNNAGDRYMLTLTFTTVASATVDGELVAVLPALTAAFTGDALADGQLAGVLPALTAAVTGDALADAVLTGQLPTLTAAYTGDAIADGQLAAILPALQAAFTDAVDIEPGTLTAGGTGTTHTAAGTSSTLTAAGSTATLTASGRP